MKTTTRLAALAGTVLLVMAAIAPFAVAATEAGNAAGNVAVETHEASDISDTSVTLNGELTAIPDNKEATVYFTYWEEGDEANTAETVSDTNDEPDTFSFELTGLEEDTTYVYVAHAKAAGTAVDGDEVTFTTGNEDDEESTDAFGLEVSAFVHSLLEDRGDSDRGIGLMVSEFVTANNPGADNRPDHAGPPEDRGKSAADNKERGPPEDKGPNAKDVTSNPDVSDGNDENEETATETET